MDSGHFPTIWNPINMDQGNNKLFLSTSELITNVYLGERCTVIGNKRLHVQVQGTRSSGVFDTEIILALLNSTVSRFKRRFGVLIYQTKTFL